MSPQKEWNTSYPRGTKLWYNIPDKKGRTSPHKCTPRKILNNTGLDMDSLKWHCTEVGLQWRNTGYIKLRICHRSTPQVPATQLNMTSEIPPPMEPPKLWHHSTTNDAPQIWCIPHLHACGVPWWMLYLPYWLLNNSLLFRASLDLHKKTSDVTNMS